jgi:hypothetical protein
MTPMRAGMSSMAASWPGSASLMPPSLLTLSSDWRYSSSPQKGVMEAGDWWGVMREST